MTSIFSKKVCLQLTPLKHVETRGDCQVANSRSTRRAHDSKTPTTETVQTITRNDQLPLTGGPQMLTTRKVGGWCAVVHQVPRSRSMKRLVHIHLPYSLKLQNHKIFTPRIPTLNMPPMAIPMGGARIFVVWGQRGG